LQRLSWPGPMRNHHAEHLLRHWPCRSHCNWARHCKRGRHGGHRGRPLRLTLPIAEAAEGAGAACHHRADHCNGWKNGCDGPGLVARGVWINGCDGATAGAVAAVFTTARTILATKTGTLTIAAPSTPAGTVLAIPGAGASTVAAVTRAARAVRALSRLARAVRAPATSA